MNRSSIGVKQNSALVVNSLSKQLNRNTMKKANTYCSVYCLIFVILTLVSLLFILMHSYHQLSAGTYNNGIHLDQMKHLIDHSKENLMNSIGKLSNNSRLFIPYHTVLNTSSTQRKKRLAYVITITKDGFFQVDLLIYILLNDILSTYLPIYYMIT